MEVLSILNLWMQILADISNKKICLVQTEDASSIGAALLGMKALKIIKDYDSLNEHEDKMINPRKKNFAVYKNYYAIFKNLYDPLKDAMHELHELNK